MKVKRALHVMTVLLVAVMTAPSARADDAAAGNGADAAAISPSYPPATHAGLGTRAQASTLATENQPAPLKTPPVLNGGHRHRGSGTADLKIDAAPAKHWVARDFQLQPSGTVKTNLKNGTSPPLTPPHQPTGTSPAGAQAFDASNLGLQQKEQDESNKYDTVSKSSSKRHDTDKNSISNVR